MKFIICLLVILILDYLLFAVWNFYAVLNKSTNPEIIQTDRELGQGDLVKYMAAGDSTAQGTGASKVETTYPYRVAKFLAMKKKVQYRNIGVSGAKLEDVIAKQLPQIIAYQPDIITISVGGNDIDRLASKKYVLNGFKTIITELTTKTTAKIYLANLPNFTGAKLLPAPYIWLIEKRSAPMNTTILKLQTDRVEIANIHDFPHTEISDRDATYSSDWFHPNDTGYQNWAKEFIEVLQ